MCFNNSLKGDRLHDIDGSQPIRAISIVGRPSPTFSDDPARADRRASMPTSSGGTLTERNAAALEALRRMKDGNAGGEELVTKGRNMGERPPEEVRRKGSYSRYLI